MPTGTPSSKTSPQPSHDVAPSNTMDAERTMGPPAAPWTSTATDPERGSEQAVRAAGRIVGPVAGATRHPGGGEGPRGCRQRHRADFGAPRRGAPGGIGVRTAAQLDDRRAIWEGQGQASPDESALHIHRRIKCHVGTRTREGVVGAAGSVNGEESIHGDQVEAWGRTSRGPVSLEAEPCDSVGGGPEHVALLGGAHRRNHCRRRRRPRCCRGSWSDPCRRSHWPRPRRRRRSPLARTSCRRHHS